MTWAEELKKEYEKIAEDNKKSNLPNGKCLPLGDTGRVRDKLAQDLEMGICLLYLLLLLYIYICINKIFK